MSIRVDDTCPLSGVHVVDDWAATLNQTNIKNNNNKFYIIQVLSNGHQYYCFNRWGRVGERGQNSCKPSASLDAAKKDFEKKFYDKTRNKWQNVKDNFSDFSPVSGKYTLLEMDHGADVEEVVEAVKKRGASSKKDVKVRESKLPEATQDLIKLIFDHDMFKEQMIKYDLNVKELPLGKISQAQINKGFAVLDEIEEAITEGSSTVNLSNSFYTHIPHSFGRKVPPPIETAEGVQQKRDMLAVLGDIELAAELEKKEEEEEGDEVDHKYDQQYKLLDTDLTPVDQKSEEFKMIHTYFTATMSQYHTLHLLEVFKVNRHPEDERFKAHDKLANRKLLWHGTNVAVVVAIMKSGLRIMPHSGGRVGKGIYFASENGKSANYVAPAQGIGIMFLNEVALGKEKHIDQDDPSLTKAPPGYDSIVAKGWTEPDPAKDVKFEIEGHEVVVPQGKPVKQQEWNHSSFSQTEYLVYKESQNHIRYLLKIKWG